MPRFVVTAITVLAASAAHADGEPTPGGRVGAAIQLGGASGISGVAGVELDAAWRHSGGTWFRAAVAGAVPVPDAGRVLEARLGIEHRREDCGGGCLYAGVDLALATADVRDDPDQTTVVAGLVIPRLGLDAGSDTLRFRLGVELWLGAARAHDREPDLVPPVDTTTTRWVTGFVVVSGVSAQF
jgi:hypothetical protein